MVDWWVWDSANRKSFIIITKKKSRKIVGWWMGLGFSKCTGGSVDCFLAAPRCFLLFIYYKRPLKKKSKDKVGRSLSVGLRFFGLFYKNLLHIILTPPGRCSLARGAGASRNKRCTRKQSRVKTKPQRIAVRLWEDELRVTRSLTTAQILMSFRFFSATSVYLYPLLYGWSC
jgi:hypothetical protein